MEDKSYLKTITQDNITDWVEQWRNQDKENNNAFLLTINKESGENHNLTIGEPKILFNGLVELMKRNNDAAVLIVMATKVFLEERKPKNND